MPTLVFAISVLLMSLSPAAGGGQDAAETPAQQLAALSEEYRPVSGGMRLATSDLERKAAVERMASFPSRFLALAEAHAHDPVALEALYQAVQSAASTDSAAQIAWETNQSDFPTGSSDDAAGKTLALVLNEHVLSANLGPLLDRMRYAYRLEYGRGLRSVLERNSHREVQALACLALAQFLNDRLNMLQLTSDRPELAECYGIVFGQDYLVELRRLKKAGGAARVEALFERAAGEFADVEFRSGTVGEIANLELFAIRHLSVGQPVPDIEGPDQDGALFKLSDYRGKVVLLYFWSEL